MAGMMPTTSGSGGHRRASDASFDLNLAPFLDIVVSIIPLLLLSAVFIEIKSIETPIPQVVAEAIENSDKKTEKETTVLLTLSHKTGFEFMITDKGRQNTIKVQAKSGTLDYETLAKTARQVKDQYPQVFKMGISPDKDISFSEIVATMDLLRKTAATERKIAFVDPKSGQQMETDLMFPNVTFANVIGE